MTEHVTRPQSSPTDDQFLTLEELRKTLRIGKTAANELARTNALPIPAVRAGRQYRFSRRALEDLMARQHGAVCLRGVPTEGVGP